MPGKPLPFTKNQIEKIIKKYPTPFHLYDEKAIRRTPAILKKPSPGTKVLKNFLPSKPLPIPT